MLATRTQSTSMLYSKLDQYPDEAWGWERKDKIDERLCMFEGVLLYK